MLARLASAVHFQSATMPPMMRPISLVVWMIVWLLPLAPVCAADLLRIEGVTWGFDGTVVANSFNPVSFSLHNDSNDPMNLPLKLERSDGVKTIDAPVGVAGPLDPVFLAPNSSRRVQLFAYVQGKSGRIHALVGARSASASGFNGECSIEGWTACNSDPFRSGGCDPARLRHAPV